LSEKNRLDKEAILERLALEISKKFHIEKEDAIKLIQDRTLE
jgi:hypothetical protein